MSLGRVVPGSETKHGKGNRTLDSTDDMCGGIELEGVLHLRDFVNDGGLLITLTSSSSLPIHFVGSRTRYHDQADQRALGPGRCISGWGGGQVQPDCVRLRQRCGCLFQFFSCFCFRKCGWLKIPLHVSRFERSCDRPWEQG